MTLSEKTRKILWARSGNRCAICKSELVIDATRQDDESVVGDECHLISSQEHGPRHDPSYPYEKLDSHENLILLCRVHHKMVDDQEETYTASILRQMKANHEKWVSERLADSKKPFSPRLRRAKKNVLPLLTRLTTGKEALDVINGCCAYQIDHDEPDDATEADLIGRFLQTVTDWGDIGDELGPAHRVSTAFELTQCLRELEDAGFLVFGGREAHLMDWGNGSEPSDWPIATLVVPRKESPRILTMTLEDSPAAP